MIGTIFIPTPLEGYVPNALYYMVKHYDNGTRDEISIVEAIYASPLGERKVLAEAKAHIIMDTATSVKQFVYEYERLDHHIDKLIEDGFVISYRNPALDYCESRLQPSNKP